MPLVLAPAPAFGDGGRADCGYRVGAMNCLQCGGPFEYAGANKEHARCTRCLALHAVVAPGHVQLIDVRAPNGQVDAQFTAIFAQQLGFAPRQATNQVLGLGPVNVVVNTGRMERDLRNKVSGMIWGWIITGIVLFVLAIGGLIFFFWIRHQVTDAAAGVTTPVAAGTGAPEVATWDGKAPYTCMGSQVVIIKNQTVTLSSGPAITAMGACQLTLDNVNLTAPQGIQVMSTAKITVKGGSIKSTGDAINAMGSGQVDVQGAKITGKTTALGPNAKITGAK
jgi:hypothetical protein